MKKPGKFFILFVLMAISVNYVTGQEVNYASNINKYLSLDGKQLVIKYDLPFPDTTQLFDIILKINYNDKVIQPHDSLLTGSWGNKISPGMEKVILWDFPNEFKNIINKVTIEVIATKMSGPLADFDYKISGNKPPFEVKFENKSKNADLYSWNFGDLKSRNNNLSQLENPVHTFKTGGAYNVELLASRSKSKTSDSIMKTMTLGKGNEQDLQKLKKLKTIWLGSAIASAGIGVYSLLRANSLYNQYKTATNNSETLRKKYKTYDVITPAALVISGVCVFEVIVQSKKIRETKQTLSMHFIPLDEGGVVGLTWNY